MEEEVGEGCSREWVGEEGSGRGREGGKERGSVIEGGFAACIRGL